MEGFGNSSKIHFKKFQRQAATILGISPNQIFKA